MSHLYTTPSISLKPKINKRFYTHDSCDELIIERLPLTNSLNILEPKERRNSKIKMIAQNRLSVNFYDTTASNSLLSSENVRSLNYSNNNRAHFSQSGDYEHLNCDQVSMDYTMFRRNMRAVFNIQGLTSSEESSEESNESECDNLDYLDINELMNFEELESSRFPAIQLHIVKDVNVHEVEINNNNGDAKTERKWISR